MEMISLESLGRELRNRRQRIELLSERVRLLLMENLTLTRRLKRVEAERNTLRSKRRVMVESWGKKGKRRSGRRSPGSG